MQEITKFSREAAETYAQTVADKKLDIASKKADSIIKYVEARYEKKIKNGIEKNNNCREISIILPRAKRCKDNNVFSEVEAIVRAHFKKLGFAVALHDGHSCSCLFDFICNHDSFYMSMTWY